MLPGLQMHLLVDCWKVVQLRTQKLHTISVIDLILYNILLKYISKLFTKEVIIFQILAQPWENPNEYMMSFSFSNFFTYSQHREPEDTG